MYHDVPGFLSGYVRTPAPTCAVPNVVAAQLPSRRLELPSLRCDERYAAVIECAGHSFLFSRRDVTLVSDAWESVVRIASGRDAPSYSEPIVTLPSELNISHNAAFTCIRNRTIAAVGGQGHDLALRPQSLFQVDPLHPGIMRRDADATVWPLVWSDAKLLVSGDPTVSGCVEERPLWEKEGCTAELCKRPSSGFFCEFDGKVSVVKLSKRSPGGPGLLVFSRANTLRDGGGRHVQVSRVNSSSKSSLRTTTKLIRFEGGYHLDLHNNIYFMHVAALPYHKGLLGLFPAVINKTAGIWCATSEDGEYWSKPLRLMGSAIVQYHRTVDWPIDIVVGRGGSYASWKLRVVLQHQVYLHEGLADPNCTEVDTPSICEYTLEMSLAGPNAPQRVCQRLAAAWAARERNATRASKSAINSTAACDLKRATNKLNWLWQVADPRFAIDSDAKFPEDRGFSGVRFDNDSAARARWGALSARAKRVN